MKTIDTFIKSLFFVFILLLIFSCAQNREQHSATGKTSLKIIPPKVTWLADLPDSNKPEARGIGLFKNFTTDQGLGK